MVIFGVLASSRYHRWLPLAAGVVLGALIVTVAPLSGAGFSPVRGLAPDILASTYPALWTYFAGPAAGSAVAAAAILTWADGKSPASCAHHASYARLLRQLSRLA